MQVRLLLEKRLLLGVHQVTLWAKPKGLSSSPLDKPRKGTVNPYLLPSVLCSWSTKHP